MRILFYGRLSEAARASERTMALPAGVCDVAGLRHALGREDEPLAEALAGAGVRVAVNGTVVVGEMPLLGDEEVAFMSPVSGG